LRRTTWAWITPGAFLAAALLAGCGGGGGGGGSSPTNNNPNPTPGTPGAVTLNAVTGGHGFATLNWTQPNSSGVTYTIQRELANGSGQPANGAVFQNLPSADGGSQATVSGTSYHDASYPDNASNGTQNITFPVVGAQYLYKVIPSTGTVSNTVASTPVLGPGTGYTIETTPPPTNSPSPFTNSNSGAHFTYTASSSGASAPVITMSVTFDYTPTTSDLDHITLDVAGDATANSGAIVYSHAQILSGLSVSGNTVTFNSANVSPALSIPTAPAYSLVLLNAYVAPSAGDTTAGDLLPIQFCYYLTAPGTSNTLNAGTSYASQFGLTLHELP
jgi:hypothetical protein